MNYILIYLERKKKCFDEKNETIAPCLASAEAYTIRIQNHAVPLTDEHTEGKADKYHQ